MALRFLHLEHGDVLDIRDENDFRHRFSDDSVLAIGKACQTLAWNSWTGGSLWMVIRGGMRLISRDLRFDLRDNDLYVSEHGARITAQTLAGESLWAIGLLLSPAKIVEHAGICAEVALIPCRHATSPHVRNVLTRLAYRACTEGNNRIDSDIELDGMLAEIVGRQHEFQPMIDRCPGRSARYRREIFLRLQRARNYIETNFGKCFDLADLANYANISRSHFLRLFHSVFGVTPHQYLTQLRMNVARELIVNESLSVAEIVLKIGFMDRCSFSRLFKQHFGISITQLRALNPRIGTRHTRAA